MTRTGLLKVGRIERYVLIQQIRSLAVALGVIASLIMLIDFVEISRGVGSNVDLPLYQIFGLMLVKSPSVILQLLPFVFLFGTLGAFVSLNRRSELIAMRAAGVSAWRFTLPAAGLAFAFGVLTVTVLGPMAAAGDGVWQRERARLSGAACHACLFAAETSCERGNHYLDRTLLVDTLTEPGSGFFAR